MHNQRNMMYPWILGISVIVAGCGTAYSHFSYDSSSQMNVPKTGQGCLDAAVLLGVNLSEAKEIAKKVLLVNGAQMKEETETHLRAWTPLQTFGGGGEEVNVGLEKVDDNQTFISVTTLTMGGMEAKSWSCEVINEIVLRAEE